MKFPSAFLLKISTANPQECEAIVPFTHEVSMLLGPEIIEVVDPTERKGNSDFFRCFLWSKRSWKFVNNKFSFLCSDCITPV
jgi:hypothetical protein